MLTQLLLGMTLALGQGGDTAPAAPLPQGTAAVPASATEQPAPPAATPVPLPPMPSPTDVPAANGNGSGNGEKKHYDGWFASRFLQAWCDQWKEPIPEETPEDTRPRRGPPSPWDVPPFPVSEFQGYPIIGSPPSEDQWPLTKAVWGMGSLGEWLEKEKIRVYGWVTMEGNFSSAHNSNSPTSYWLVPNKIEMDQTVLRFERELDSVQTDHWDWAFRSSFLYGIDYRYMSAGGWFQNQFVDNNRLYGFDPTEQYFDIYIPPHFFQGTIVRFGRWIACPDIETQFAPDNYMGSHSILFTYDTYTQTGFMVTHKLSDQWIFQWGLNAGDDMAPWYKGAVPCGYLGLRWVSPTNHDAIYTVINQLDDASFSYNTINGQTGGGHDNYNYWVTTWEHVFNPKWHNKLEWYFMYERDAQLGGTTSFGPPQPFGGGGGPSPVIPGTSHAYGYVDYMAYELSKKDYITFRNEVWEDDTGFRAGYKGLYTDWTIGLSHNFNTLFQVRPEVGYYRNWTNEAFDNGTEKGLWMVGMDMTIRF